MASLHFVAKLALQKQSWFYPRKRAFEASSFLLECKTQKPQTRESLRLFYFPEKGEKNLFARCFCEEFFTFLDGLFNRTDEEEGFLGEVV